METQNMSIDSHVGNRTTDTDILRNYFACILFVVNHQGLYKLKHKRERIVWFVCCLFFFFPGATQAYRGYKFHEPECDFLWTEIQ